MGKYFGTDGVRGKANESLTPELAYKLGRAGAYVLAKENKHSAKIIVGMDTRISGSLLETSLIAGILSVGAKAVSLGVVPTPAVAYLTRKYGADAGVVISASHNPYYDNGIKFFNSQGYKLKDELENEIEEIMDNSFDDITRATNENTGTLEYNKTAVEDYVNYLKTTVNVDFKGLKIALDCANGATYMAGPEIFEMLGAELYPIHNTPNGVNINNNCGSTHLESLKKYVLEIGADIGVAFDGDGDRCLLVDEKGELTDGDSIMALCGLYLKDKGKLKNNTIVATVMSNLGLFIMGEEKGINIEKTKVGDRYVIEHMLKTGDNFGGEQSGHIIFHDYNTTGDGILTALQVLSIIKETGKKLSELKSVMTVLPQVLINARVKQENKNKYLTDDEIKKSIEEVENKFKSKGRVLIRPSGTEPLVRVMIEGEDIALIEKEAKKLSLLIEKKLG